MRVVIIAHGHPELRAGGAERAAYSLFSELKKAAGVDPIFVATTNPETIGHDGAFGAFRGQQDELLWAPPPIEWFKLSSERYDTLRQQCVQLIETLKPDVVHVHHYLHTGVELFSILKSISSARLLLTLHEFILICANHGQMVRRGSGELCYAAAPVDCTSCFPDQTSGKFFLRERFIQRSLESIDHFVSPSAFLKSRFTAWGLDTDRISTIENPLPSAGTEPAHRPRHGGKRLRLGFFGQFTPFKGASLLLQAVNALPDAYANRVELVLFGANLGDWPDLASEVEELIAASRVRVRFFGRYRNPDVIQLMRSVDWIVVPSTWWENSPLVIQEARVAGVPVLAANIGGMREKVIDEITGRHFMAASALDLANKIEAIIDEDPREWPRLNVTEHNERVVREHLRAYAPTIDLSLRPPS